MEIVTKVFDVSQWMTGFRFLRSNDDRGGKLALTLETGERRKAFSRGHQRLLCMRTKTTKTFQDDAAKLIITPQVPRRASQPDVTMTSEMEKYCITRKDGFHILRYGSKVNHFNNGL